MARAQRSQSQYKQLHLPDVGPMSVDLPIAPLDDERQRAIDASVRYLDAVEKRVREMSWGPKDRDYALASITARCEALARERRVR